MAQNAPLVLRLLASSVTAANRAGKIIRDIMTRGDLGIVEKGINDLQTEADRSAQRCIVASLSQQYPNLTIIGEEETSNCEVNFDACAKQFFSHCKKQVPSDWIVTDQDSLVLQKQCPQEYANITNDDIVVWVDPLDGTSEYTQGLLEHVTVLVGLAVKGRPIAGVIHQPYFNYKNENSVGRTIWGLVGVGVGGFEPQYAPPGKFIVTTTRSHSDGTVQMALDALNPDEVIRVGGAGHKVLLLIEGKAHAYVFASRGCKKWDTCAPEAVLVATGGKLTDMHGCPYDYGRDVGHPNVGGVFATIKGLQHSSLLQKIPQEVKDKLQ